MGSCNSQKNTNLKHHRALCADLVSGALYSGEGSDDADPVVELGNEVAASHLHRRLEVHDLVRDVELVVDRL